MKTREPTFRIPRGARERIVERYESGAKSKSEYRRGKAVVAVMLWEEDGGRAWGWTLRDGVRHGHSMEWHPNGRVSFVEPFVNGLVHGTARHYDDGGALRAVMPFVRGTGVDVWCHGAVISEETRLEGGSPTLIRGWKDDRTVDRETPYRDGVEHGIAREWNARGKLRRGFPKFFVRGERVDRRRYLQLARLDATLPPYHVRDNSPKRALPAEYTACRK